jgi:transmembrane sensor
MSTISDHHQYLFLGKITNSLSTEEERELQTLFAQDDQAREAYNELVNQLPREQVAQSFNHLNTPGFWKNISGELHDQYRLVKQRQFLRGGLAFIAIGIVAVGSWLFLSRPQTGDQPVVHRNHAIPKTPAGSVELQLADGSTVNLSTTTGSIQQGQLALDNKDQALSYQAVKGEAIGVNTVQVPVAMDYKVNLSDGSEIWLNSTSSLSFPSRFTSGKREITVTGEAYCKVAKNVKQPFIVHLPNNTTVEVTGTEFNINTYKANTVKVALVTGHVNLLAAQHKASVEPGLEAVAINDQIALAPFHAEKTLSWRKGVYLFEGADLDEIAAVLHRWFGITTQLDDPALAQKKFTGALYKNEPLSSFLDNFKVISHIDSYVDEKKVLHFTVAK